jgi:hypothetical protein
MSNEEKVSIVSRSFEEDKRDLAVVHDVFAVEDCTAKCPTCQQTCEYTAGHAGLHHCPAGHEWI